MNLRPVLLVAVATVGCGSSPGSDEADARTVDTVATAADADVPVAVGQWLARVEPPADCSYSLLVGGAVIVVAPSGFVQPPLAVKIRGGDPLQTVDLVVDSVSCASFTCNVTAEEGQGTTKIRYVLAFDGDELSGSALSGSTCSIPVSGARL